MLLEALVVDVVPVDAGEVELLAGWRRGAEDADEESAVVVAAVFEVRPGREVECPQRLRWWRGSVGMASLISIVREVRECVEEDVR